MTYPLNLSTTATKYCTTLLRHLISFKVLNITNSLLIHQAIRDFTQKSSKGLKIVKPFVTVGAICQHCFFNEKWTYICYYYFFFLSTFQRYSS